MLFLIRRILLTACCSLPLFHGLAQLPVQHLDAPHNTQPLQHTLSFFEDKTARVEAAQILSGALDHQFKQSNNDALNFGVTHSVIWLGFVLQQDAPPLNPDWMLSFDYPLFDYVTLYTKQQNGEWKIDRSGDMLPFRLRSMPYRNFAFPLHLPDTPATTCYIRLASSGSMQIKLTLQPSVDFLYDDLYAELGHGIFFGALLIMMCYNLFLFFGLGNKAYLAYVAFILVNLLLQAAFSGHVTQYILGDAPWWANRIIPLLMSSSSIVTALFSIIFLNTRRFARVTHTILVAIIACAGINFMLSFFLSLSLTISIAGIFVILACIMVIVAGIQSLRKGNRAARFYLLAWAFLIASGLVTSLRNFGFLEPGFFTTHCVRIASVVEAILLAMALADRYRLYKKEKEAAQAETLRIQQEANRELEEKVKERTLQLHQSLEDLKTTQAQLVQKEKMASLGELTAGIAHEIQNPLNFVTNFAEVSEELVSDLKAELQSGSSGQAGELATQLENNLGKIAHHGHRAGSIVKGMLLHSRKDIGEKRPVDLCALVQECMQLAFHSFKARNKLFHADLVTHFDEPVIAYNCNPQELDRVLVNLYANALYALHKRKQSGTTDFKPVLTASIRRKETAIEISVHDNGPGIAPAILDKIFQPFFTTKPANQGTGLGLSISYDIITKGFAGDLTVTSIENDHTEFIVRLPLSSNKTTTKNEVQ